ncbi:MAG: lipoprotein insertase outer membrane protein LolB [Sulfurifustis sp.]
MRLLVLLLFLMLLAGCAAVPERPAAGNVETEWAARREALLRLDAWELRGRVALRTPQEGVQGSLHWSLAPQEQRVDLAGPFGGGRVRLSVGPDGAELRDANNKVYRDASVEALLARVTGWRLPLAGLRYWVVGVPAPDAPARIELDEWGRLQSLAQLGWTIRFIDYVREGAYELPRRVFIESDAREGPDPAAEARLVIDQWSVARQARSEQ